MLSSLMQTKLDCHFSYIIKKKNVCRTYKTNFFLLRMRLLQELGELGQGSTGGSSSRESS